MARTEARKEERGKGGSKGSKRGRQQIHKTSGKGVGLSLVCSRGTVWCRVHSRSSANIASQVLVPPAPPHFLPPRTLLLHCPISPPNEIPRSLTADTLSFISASMIDWTLVYECPGIIYNPHYNSTMTLREIK